MLFTRTNKLMREQLELLDIYWVKYRKYLNNKYLLGVDITPEDKTFEGIESDGLEFTKFIMDEIVVDKGCYIFKNNLHDDEINPKGEFIANKFDINRSAFENNYNHFHIMGIFIKNDIQDIVVLAVGISLVNILWLKLNYLFPNVHFRIDISYPVIKIFDENEFIKDDCRISFHAIRENEEIYLDLEEYKYEAVGVLEW